jgi:hypothetical protein
MPRTARELSIWRPIRELRNRWNNCDAIPGRCGEPAFRVAAAGPGGVDADAEGVACVVAPVA